MRLHNKFGKEELLRRLLQEDFDRTTLSFYRYVRIDNVEIFRNHLYASLHELNIYGRIYVAHEGINAQLSVPLPRFDEFKNLIQENLKLKDAELKFAVEDDGRSFYKLIVRIRKKIVADGLPDDAIDFSRTGTHLNAEEFNRAIKNPRTLIIDMRNSYESEVGRFENALCPDADTFREALPKALEMAEGKKDHKILLYCTGGIRCEKASAYFLHHGYKDVNQLYGGIIAYAHEVKSKNLPSKFSGKNFVFDNRLGERITNEILSTCHQCGKPSDRHTNCMNQECHLLFIQCEECNRAMQGCCSHRCAAISKLPSADQQKIRKGKTKMQGKNIFSTRLRPRPDLISDDIR